MNKNKNPFSIQIPTDVREMTVKNVIGAMLWRMASDKGEDVQLDMLHNANSMYCNIDKEDAMMLSDENIIKIGKAVGHGFTSITEYWNECVKNGGLPVSVSVSTTPYWEIDTLKAEIEESKISIRKWKLKRELKELNKPTTFYCQKDLSVLPAEIWANFLDDVISKVQGFGDKFWLEWGQIPTVLAHILWSEDESILVKDFDGVLSLNRKRIKDFEERIALNIKATEALELFAFFLLNRTNYSHAQLIKRYSRILASENQSVQKESNSIKSGASSTTSKK